MPVVIPLIAAGVGIYQAIKSNQRANEADAASKELFNQRKPYQMPNQVLDVFNQAQNNAQYGFDPTTMAYYTSEAQGSLASTLGTAKQLGADPNNLSALLDQSFQNIFKIGAENNLLKLKKFDSLVGATQYLVNNKDAEYASQQNLIKDQMATQFQKGQAAQAGLQSGINLALSGISSAASSLLYNQGDNSSFSTPPVSNRSNQAYQSPLSPSIPQTTTLPSNFNFQIQPPNPN